MTSMIKTYTVRYGESAAIGFMLMHGLPFSAIKAVWLLSAGKGTLCAHIISTALFAVFCALIIALRSWFQDVRLAADGVCCGCMCGAALTPLTAGVLPLPAIYANIIQCCALFFVIAYPDYKRDDTAHRLTAALCCAAPFALCLFFPITRTIIEALAAAGITGCALSRACSTKKPLSARGILFGMLLCAAFRAVCIP